MGFGQIRAGIAGEWGNLQKLFTIRGSYSPSEEDVENGLRHRGFSGMVMTSLATAIPERIQPKERWSELRLWQLLPAH